MNGSQIMSSWQVHVAFAKGRAEMLWAGFDFAVPYERSLCTRWTRANSIVRRAPSAEQVREPSVFSEKRVRKLIWECPIKVCHN
jgi:hypothetical protein